MSKIKIGKKFAFATISMVCITVTACLLKYQGEIYFKLVTAVCGIFLIAQGYVDAKKGVKDENN